MTTDTNDAVRKLFTGFVADVTGLIGEGDLSVYLKPNEYSVTLTLPEEAPEVEPAKPAARKSRAKKTAAPTPDADEVDEQPELPDDAVPPFAQPGPVD